MAQDQDQQPTEWVIEDLEIDSATLGETWRLLVQRPCNRAAARGLPWIWLLHGRNGSIADMRPLLVAIAGAMRAGDLPPAVVAAPDAPDDHRTSWWIDSDHLPDGAEGIPPGRLLERSLLGDVLPSVEARYGAPDGPASRVIGGISMGGGAALRWLLVRPDLFGSAVLLSPGVFERLPAHGSAMRRRDVVDVEGSIFDSGRYAERLHYPTLLDAVDPDRPPARVVVLVGDEEPVRLDPVDRRDLELEAARLHAALKIHPAFHPSLRVVGGGHEWALWERGIVTALRILAGREPITES